MGTRFLTFHRTEPSGNEIRMSPSAFYIDRDCLPVGFVIYAESAPKVDAFVDIFDDGVSIFNNRESVEVNSTTGAITQGTQTAQFLTAGENSEDVADDFIGTTIEEGSWIHATLKSGDGRNFTAQLALFSDDNETSEVDEP